jgi:hypothetical protein
MTGNHISVFELQQTMKQRESKHVEIFATVLDRCYARIRRCASVNRVECVYDVPEIIIGKPLYDVDVCVKFVAKHLAANGFSVTLMPKRHLHVSWDVAKPAASGGIQDHSRSLQYQNHGPYQNYQNHGPYQNHQNHSRSVQYQNHGQYQNHQNQDRNQVQTMDHNHTRHAQPLALCDAMESMRQMRLAPLPPPPGPDPRAVPPSGPRATFRPISTFRPSHRFMLTAS